MPDNLVLFPRFRRAQFSLPPDASPLDDYQPVRIRDDSFRDLGVYKNDILSADLTHPPRHGQLTLVRTPRESLLGFVYKSQCDGLKLEYLCASPCCPPETFAEGEALAVAPVVWLCRTCDGVSCDFAFTRFREELWREGAKRNSRVEVIAAPAAHFRSESFLSMSTGSSSHTRARKRSAATKGWTT